MRGVGKTHTPHIHFPFSRLVFFLSVVPNRIPKPEVARREYLDNLRP